MKWHYWPPHLTCLDSLTQSTPATSCLVLAREYSNKRHRERRGHGRCGGRKINAAHPDTNIFKKSKSTYQPIQSIVTCYNIPSHTHHCHYIHASMEEIDSIPCSLLTYRLFSLFFNLSQLLRALGDEGKDGSRFPRRPSLPAALSCNCQSLTSAADCRLAPAPHGGA